MTGIKIPVSADFDGADLEKTIAKLNEQMNRLAQGVAAANKVQFTPVSKGTLQELKQVEERFKELTKISGALRDRIKATGQGGSSFGGLDWTRLYDDPVIRQRKMMQAFQHVTAGTAYGLQVPSPASPGGRQPAPPPSEPPPPRRPNGPTVGGTLGGIAAAGLRATGPVGGVVANAGGAAAAGGFSAGLMGLFGGLAALAVGKGIGAIKDKADAAGQEGIGYDTIKRTLGDVNVSFSLLRESLRAASYDIDTTFEQTQKLGTDFAKLSGVTRDQYKTIAEEVKVGGGFGRSFGMDPEQSNAFFAQMRQFRVTENVNDSRRLALMIGEAVGKSGQFGKMDEVLQAISGFAATQTRSSLAGANVEGYAGQLAGFMSSRTPGLDAQGAAALLGRVNGAIAGGGAIGEAGQNYLYSALGKKYGLDPVQTALLQQQGAFGTGRTAFGSGSLYAQFSRKFGGSVPGAAASSDETNISTILAKIQRDYASNPSLMLNATARLLGVNENQAMALHTIAPQSLGGITGRMGRLGLDMGSLSATGISALANIETGDRTTLLGQAAALRKSRKPLSVEENARLNDAIDSGSTEKLRDILTELTYSREQEQTEGSKTRESIQGVDKRIQELATHLVGPMNDMRNALVYLAGGREKLGATGIAERVMRTESAENIENMKAKNAADIDAQRAIISDVGVNDATGKLGALSEEYRNKIMGAGSEQEKEALREELKKKREALLARRTEAQKRIVDLQEEMSKAEESEKKRLETEVRKLKIQPATPGTGGDASAATKQEFQQRYGDAARRAGTALGVDPKFILAQWGVETGWGRSIIPGTNNLGNIKDFRGRGVAARDNATGRVDNYRAFDSMDAFADHYVSLIKRKYPNAVGAGSDGAKFAAGLNGYAEDGAYGSKILRSSNGLFPDSAPLPAGGRTQADQQSQTVNFNGEFTLVTPSGQRVGDPLRMNKRVAMPTPSGG
jgi:flagellum-specific peptidoglycan hydrolase FlgJ